MALLLSLLLSLLLIERSMERKEVGRWFYGGLAAITVGVLVRTVGVSGRKSVVYPYDGSAGGDGVVRGMGG